MSSRKQHVKVGNECSKVTDVISGVPQGSVLGPTLFIYYVNDMPDALDCLIQIFAVDTVQSKIKIQESIEKFVQ